MLCYLAMLDTPEEKGKFESLYHTYRLKMYYIADKILGDSFLAEDAVHEAFLRIARNFYKIEEVESARTQGFVLTITTNAAKTLRCKKNPQEILVEDFLEVEDEGQSVEEQVFDHIGCDEIIAEIGKLPALYVEVLQLSTLQECTNREISQLLDIPIETVKKRLQRGKKLLITRLR